MFFILASIESIDTIKLLAAFLLVVAFVAAGGVLGVWEVELSVLVSFVVVESLLQLTKKHVAAINTGNFIFEIMSLLFLWLRKKW
jgi:hypothetical protein